MQKLEDLQSWFKNKKDALVALSGGVDSALVAHTAFSTLGSSAIAVTADYQTLSSEELETSKKIAKEIGIEHMIINYSELENPEFVKNDKNRCFHCRTELAENLLQLANSRNIETVVDGTNVDDLGDYRPGMIAMTNNGIHSPLLDVGLSKIQIRDMAKNLGISIFDKPSNSCLASRIPWGQTITTQSLVRVELAEKFVKQKFGITQIRVRDINRHARIEVLRHEIPLIKNQQEKIFSQFKLLGFLSLEIDPNGYSQGKLNVIVD